MEGDRVIWILRTYKLKTNFSVGSLYWNKLSKNCICIVKCVWSVMSIVDLPYRCTQYVRSHCPFSTVCLSVRSVNVYCPSASAITAPRQIPVRLFVLAIEMLLLFYSESGSHCNTGQKWNLFSGQQLNLTIKRKRNLCMMSGTLESWFTLLLS